MYNSWQILRVKAIALIAVCLLVFQSFIASFAVSYAAGSPMLDAFGNPICITLSAISDRSSDQDDLPLPPACCNVACNMFSTPNSNVEGSHWFADPLTADSANWNLVSALPIKTFAAQYGSASPRSPPQ